MLRVVFGLLWLFHWLPFRVQALICAVLGELAFVLARSRRRVTLTNLRLCFPAWDAGERRRVARAHFRLLLTSFFEQGLLRWGSAKRLQRLVHWRDAEHYLACRRQQVPVILLTPHFVGLDWGATSIGLHGITGATMYSQQKRALVTDFLVKTRTRFAPNRLFSRQDGIKPALRALKELKLFYYLPDQDFGRKESIFVSFFGVQAATIPALSRLCKVSGAVVVPCIPRRLPGGRGYEVRFYPPWDNFPSDEVQADTRRVNAFIEERVREMPAQYYWAHKRFKTRPEGEPAVY